MVQMFGWFREDAALASRWKRLRACASWASSSGEELQGDVTTKLQVFRLIHHTHATAADLAEDAVMRHCLPLGLGRRGHWIDMLGADKGKVNARERVLGAILCADSRELFTC